MSVSPSTIDVGNTSVVDWDGAYGFRTWVEFTGLPLDYESANPNGSFSPSVTYTGGTPTGPISAQTCVEGYLPDSTYGTICLTRTITVNSSGSGSGSLTVLTNNAGANWSINRGVGSGAGTSAVYGGLPFNTYTITVGSLAGFYCSSNVPTQRISAANPNRTFTITCNPTSSPGDQIPRIGNNGCAPVNPPGVVDPPAVQCGSSDYPWYSTIIPKDHVWGWSFDPDSPTTPNQVQLYFDGSAGNCTPPICTSVTVTANTPRQDIVTAFGASLGVTGNHGYLYRIPVQYCDGATHVISAYGINTDATGANSVDTESFICGNAALPLTGTIDTIISPRNVILGSGATPGTITGTVSGGTGSGYQVEVIIRRGDGSVVNDWTGLGWSGSISMHTRNAFSGTWSISGTAIPPLSQMTNGQFYSVWLNVMDSSGASCNWCASQLNILFGNPVPTVTIFDNGTPVSGIIPPVPYNSNHIITWSSPTAVTCTGSDGAAGITGGTSGTIFNGPLTAPTTTYTMTCINGGGSGIPATVTIPVTQPPAPTVTLSATSLRIPYDTATDLVWNPTNAVRCDASGDWTGPQTATPGPHILTTGLLTSAKTYTIICYNIADVPSAPAAVTVDVDPPAPPTGTITAISDTDYCSGNVGMNISWQYNQTALPISAYQVDVQGTTAGSGKVFTSATSGIYTTPGALGYNTGYTVELTVWDTADQQSTALITSSYSTKNGPWVQPVIAFDPPQPAAGQVVTFTDTSGFPPGTTWLWDFGDGTSTSTATDPTTHTYATQQSGRTVTLQSQSALMIPYNAFCSDTLSLDVAKPIPGYREVRPGS